MADEDTILLSAFEFGNELLDGVVDREFAAVGEQHDGRGGHGLRNRGQEEYGARRFGGAEALLEDVLAATYVERCRAHVAGVDLRLDQLHCFVDLLSPKGEGKSA